MLDLTGAHKEGSPQILSRKYRHKSESLVYALQENLRHSVLLDALHHILYFTIHRGRRHPHHHLRNHFQRHHLHSAY